MAGIRRIRRIRRPRRVLGPEGPVRCMSDETLPVARGHVSCPHVSCASRVHMCPGGGSACWHLSRHWHLPHPGSGPARCGGTSIAQDKETPLACHGQTPPRRRIGRASGRFRCCVGPIPLLPACSPVSSLVPASWTHSGVLTSPRLLARADPRAVVCCGGPGLLWTFGPGSPGGVGPRHAGGATGDTRHPARPATRQPWPTPGLPLPGPGGARAARTLPRASDSDWIGRW